MGGVKSGIYRPPILLRRVGWLGRCIFKGSFLMDVTGWKKMRFHFGILLCILLVDESMYN